MSEIYSKSEMMAALVQLIGLGYENLENALHQARRSESEREELLEAHALLLDENGEERFNVMTRGDKHWVEMGGKRFPIDLYGFGIPTLSDEDVVIAREDGGLHQKIMDQAYDYWQSDEMKGSSYAEILDALSPMHRHAMVLGNLHYQVNNGGFCQWVDNGYGVGILSLKRAIGLMVSKFEVTGEDGHLQATRGAKAIVDKVVKATGPGLKEESFWKRSLPDSAYEGFEELDEAYYDGLGERFMEAAEAWLISVVLEASMAQGV